MSFLSFWEVGQLKNKISTENINLIFFFIFNFDFDLPDLKDKIIYIFLKKKRIFKFKNGLYHEALRFELLQ